MSALSKAYVNGLIDGDGTTIVAAADMVVFLVASTGTGSFSQAAFVDAVNLDDVPSTALLRRTAATGTKSVSGINASFIDVDTVTNTNGVVNTLTASGNFLAPDVDIAGLTYDKVLLARWDTDDATSDLIAYLDTTGGVQANGANVTLTLPANGNLFQIPTTA